MKLRLHKPLHIVTIGVLAPFLLGAVTVNECPKEKPTPASYTWNFTAEANRLFEQFENYSQSLIDTTDRLALVSQGPSNLSWRMHAQHLREAKADVNDMNEILCRLQTIRSAVEPWQAKLIDRIRKDTVLSAIHVGGAIEYLNDHHARIEDVGSPVYHQHIDVLYTSAQDLNNMVDAYTNLASAQARVQSMEPAS